jgi:hypothetical protein
MRSPPPPESPATSASLPSVSFERSIATRVIKLGADFAVGASAGTGQGDSFAATFPELAGLRYLLAVGTIEPRKNHLGTLLAGSPRPTSFDRGMRNTWHLLAATAYPARAYASHMPRDRSGRACLRELLPAELRDGFVGLDPLGDLDAKTRRTKEALTQARRAESKSGGEHSPGSLALIVTQEGPKIRGPRHPSSRENAMCGAFSSSTVRQMSLP